MFDLIAQVLAFFYSLVPSYGVAIILLTLAVMIVVTPLTLKSTRSMLQMQRLQPELKAIQTRYKDDRQKMNEELMAFYQENGINPLGGCLPLLVQLPVFLVLFRVVQGITRHATDAGLAGGGPPEAHRRVAPTWCNSMMMISSSTPRTCRSRATCTRISSRPTR